MLQLSKPTCEAMYEIQLRHRVQYAFIAKITLEARLFIPFPCDPRYRCVLDSQKKEGGENSSAAHRGQYKQSLGAYAHAIRASLPRLISGWALMPSTERNVAMSVMER